MTMHSAKGLNSASFVLGMEDNIFPHSRIKLGRRRRAPILLCRDYRAKNTSIFYALKLEDSTAKPPTRLRDF